MKGVVLKMIKRKIFGVVLVGTMTFSMLAGCAAKSVNSSKGISESPASTEAAAVGSISTVSQSPEKDTDFVIPVGAAEDSKATAAEDATKDSKIAASGSVAKNAKPAAASPAVKSTKPSSDNKPVENTNPVQGIAVGEPNPSAPTKSDADAPTGKKFNRLILPYVENQVQDMSIDRVDTDGTSFIVVYGGMQNSGGYWMDTKEQTDASGVRNVEVVFHRPAPDEMVTEAITYPNQIIEFKPGEKVNIKLVNEADMSVLMEKTIE
jgi:hypothetical protein